MIYVEIDACDLRQCCRVLIQAEHCGVIFRCQPRGRCRNSGCPTLRHVGGVKAGDASAPRSLPGSDPGPICFRVGRDFTLVLSVIPQHGPSDWIWIRAVAIPHLRSAICPVAHHAACVGSQPFHHMAALTRLAGEVPLQAGGAGVFAGDDFHNSILSHPQKLLPGVLRRDQAAVQRRC